MKNTWVDYHSSILPQNFENSVYVLTLKRKEFQNLGVAQSPEIRRVSTAKSENLNEGWNCAR